MADVAADLKTWSTTASSNSPSGATTIGTGLDDNLREIQKVVRQDLASKGSDIASADTTDLGAIPGLMHDITGTTTITGLGTVAAGIWKIVKFEGVALLTHNGTSLILPGASNITTANGDIGLFFSEGSGNWRCVTYMKANGSHLGPVLGAEVATTSGVSVDITGIPSWAKQIVILFDEVSASGTSDLLLQIGDTDGIENTGYRSAAGDSSASASSTAGFILTSATAAAATWSGRVTLSLQDAANFRWVCGVSLGRTDTANYMAGGGSKATSAALDRIRLTTVGGTDTFDAGAISILYE